MSCRDEILECVREVLARTGREDFAVGDILECMRRRSTTYSDSTIRTHIVARLSANAPHHHAVTYPDLERTRRGTYRLRQFPSRSTPAPRNPRPSGPAHRSDGESFQILAGKALGRRFETSFSLNRPIPIGDPPKHHRFDLVSVDGRYVAECKAYSWTESGNVPSAKIATANEAVFYLSLLPDNVTKLLVLRRSESPGRKETVARYYARLQRHLLGCISVLELADDGTLIDCSPKHETREA